MTHRVPGGNLMVGFAFAFVFLLCALQCVALAEIDSIAGYRESLQEFAVLSFWACVASAVVGVIDTIRIARELFF